MKLITELDLDLAPINVCVDDFLAHNVAMRDYKNNPLFAVVERGVNYVDNNSAPSQNDVPMLTVWHDSEQMLVDNNKFYGQRFETVLSCFLYFYSFDKKDIQKARSNFIRHWLRRLAEPEKLGGAGLMPSMYPDGSPVWGFINNQIVRIDHTNAYKRLTDFYIVKHPWYVTRVDIEVYTNPLPQSLP